MVYENVPEHAGFNKKGAKEAYEAELAETPRSVEELLTSIDSKLQVFVDAFEKAQADDEGGEDSAEPDATSGADGSDEGKGTGSTEPAAAPSSSPADPQSGDGKSAPVKKTAAAPKKQAEVKGD